MKKMLIIVLGLIFVCSCAPVTMHPIHLRYAPEQALPQRDEKLKDKTITVTAFADARGATDQAIIGIRVDLEDKEIPFVSSPGNPAVEVTRAFKTYLSQKRYTVRGETPVWNLDPQGISQEWGDLVIGGSIEELSLMVKSQDVRVVYECKLKLKVAVVDVEKRIHKYRETIESSSSYQSATFYVRTAEKRINKLLTQAVESALRDLEKE